MTFTSNLAAVWGVKGGAAAGTITSAGVYTAPATAGTYQVIAIANGTPVSVPVTVFAALSATPASLTLAVGASADITTSLDHPTITVDPQAGTFTGLHFTAGTKPGHYTVNVSASFAPTEVATIALDVVPRIDTNGALIEGTANASVTLAGAGFGSAPGSSTVTLGGTPLAVSAWSESSLTVTLPASALANPIVVTVNNEPSAGLRIALPWGAASAVTASTGMSQVLAVSDGGNGVLLAELDTAPATTFRFVHVTGEGLIDSRTAAFTSTHQVSYDAFVSDGVGGALLAYIDDTSLVVRSLSADMQLGLRAGPAVEGTSPSSAFVTTDSAGGAYVGMNDTGVLSLQHVRADGSLTAPTSGSKVGALIAGSSTLLALVPSGKGAIALIQGASGSAYAVAMPPLGGLAAPVTLVSGATFQSPPTAITDNNGGAYAVWIDSASGLKSKAQHIKAEGTLLYGASGKDLGVSLQPGSDLEGASAAPNGDLITFWNRFVGSGSYDLDVHRATAATGAEVWVNGVNVASGSGNHYGPVCATPSAGAIAAGLLYGIEVQGQLVTPAGATKWDASTQMVAPGADGLDDLQVICGAAGGGVFVWRDMVSTPPVVYVAGLTSAGAR